MPQKTETITLGETEYQISRLPIGVLRELDAQVADAPDPALSKKESELWFFDQTLEIIHAALKTKYPTITIDQLKLLESDMQEFFTARGKILKFAGLIQEEPQKGEARAAAT